jgi:hypothetical protein
MAAPAIASTTPLSCPGRSLITCAIICSAALSGDEHCLVAAR